MRLIAASSTASISEGEGNDLIYAGKVDGFDPTAAKDLQLRMKPLIRKNQPYARKIAHRGIWVEPSLLAEIEYRAKSAEGRNRLGIRVLRRGLFARILRSEG
jgi:bifunctional non-homologous end joining protein LigD